MLAVVSSAPLKFIFRVNFVPANCSFLASQGWWEDGILPTTLRVKWNLHVQREYTTKYQVPGHKHQRVDTTFPRFVSFQKHMDDSCWENNVAFKVPLNIFFSLFIILVSCLR